MQPEMLGEGTHGPVAEHREQRARQARAGQPEPAERGEPGSSGLRHGGHRAEDEPAAHQAPPGRSTTSNRARCPSVPVARSSSRSPSAWVMRAERTVLRKLGRARSRSDAAAHTRSTGAGTTTSLTYTGRRTAAATTRSLRTGSRSATGQFSVMNPTPYGNRAWPGTAASAPSRVVPTGSGSPEFHRTPRRNAA